MLGPIHAITRRASSVALCLCLFACGELPADTYVDGDAGPLGEKVIHGDRDTTGAFPWSARIQSSINGCTATILSEHFLLTAAHCTVNLTEGSELSVFVFPNDALSTWHQAPASYIEHPNYPSNTDVALVHLRGAELEHTQGRHARFFADARSPFSSGEPTTVFFAGYGYGSPYGGANACSTSLERGILRWSAARLVSQTGVRLVLAEGFNASRSCDGDSGMGYFLQREAAGETQTMLLYAVGTGSQAGTNRFLGNHVNDLLSWIEGGIRERSVYPISRETNHIGYTSMRFIERAIGPRTVVSSNGLCMTVGAAGQPVTLTACNGSASQQFTLEPNGRISAQGLCLDMFTASATSPVVANVCNAALHPQRFGLTTLGRITGPFGSSVSKCISAPSTTPVAGDTLRFRTCQNNAADAFRWWNLATLPGDFPDLPLDPEIGLAP